MKIELNKGELKALERLFAAEIDDRLPAQFNKSNMAILSLQKQNMAEEIVMQLPGRFPVTVKGWALTEYGRMTWCKHCSEHPLTCPECEAIGGKACSEHGTKQEAP